MALKRRLRERLLVVDDERAQREALQQHLTRAGFIVDAAGSGREAVENLAERSYSLLITDLGLPDMDGLAVAHRAFVLHRNVGVLLITAHASAESALEAAPFVVYDYLLKPLVLKEVERKARSLLVHCELVRENELLRRTIQEWSEGAQTMTVPVPADHGTSGDACLNLQEAVRRFQKAHIAMVLQVSEGNREKAAEQLGISPATLYRRLGRLGLKA